jgi:hypothetical protein
MTISAATLPPAARLDGVRAVTQRASVNGQLAPPEHHEIQHFGSRKS